MTIPQSTAAWVLNSQNGIESLEFLEQLDLPTIEDNEVLVKIHAASLNYRDLMITKVTHLHVQYLSDFDIRLFVGWSWTSTE